MFALSSTARNIGKVFHFRIQRSLIGAYFVSDKISFATLGELIRYYQNNSRSLGVPLDEPCAQQVCIPPRSHTQIQSFWQTNSQNQIMLELCVYFDIITESRSGSVVAGCFYWRPLRDRISSLFLPSGDVTESEAVESPADTHALPPPPPSHFRPSLFHHFMLFNFGICIYIY